MNESGPLLEVMNLKVAFGHHSVLNGISFALNKNEVISVIGKSGSGKTVLLKTLAGLIKPSDGHFNLSTDNQIGFAFQRSPLFPWLTVLENLELCTDTPAEKNLADQLLKNVGLWEFRNHLPKDISGGMAQKVNLLRALIKNCTLLLMDEPFGSLDSLQRSELQQFTYDTCRSAGQSIILITHDIDEALLLSDRIFILNAQTGKFENQFSVHLKKTSKLIGMRNDPGYQALYSQIAEAI